MTERQRFIDDVYGGLFSMTEVCARYGISRKTGYKWLDRYGEHHGRAGLGDRSHAPQRCPHKIGDDVARAIRAARRAHPSWGPRKPLDWLARREPTLSLPAGSTAGGLLTREGLVKAARQPPAPSPSRRRGARHPVS